MQTTRAPNNLYKRDFLWHVRNWGKQIWNHKVLYLMFAPCVLYYVLFCYVPMGGIALAFKSFSFKKGIWGSPWSTPLFKYFQTFFQSYDAPRLIRNTLVVGVMKCILEFPIPILLALMLNELYSPAFKKVTQTVTYLPHFMSSVIVVTMLQRILAPDVGMLNQIKAMLGGDGSTYYLMEEDYFYPLLFIMDIWKSTGWSSIVYLAAISGVSPELHEAASIDGCNKLKRVWHITLPSIRGTIGVLFILGIGGLFSSGFDQIYLLRTPGNMALADTLDTYIVKVGLSNGQFGYATAISLCQGVIGLLLVLGCNALSKKVTEVGIW
ncbi:MAG: ABC transporter permease subunit [Clostridia bacterium]